MSAVKLLPVCVASIVWIVLAGCSSVPDNMLARIGSDTLFVPEYEHMFLRTRVTPPLDEEEKRDFLTTYTDYLVKVKEAERQGLGKETAFVAEMSEYRNNLALTFLYENELVEPGLHTLYDRRLEEIKLQQLLVKWLPGEDNAGDTIGTWEKAQVVHGILRAGKLPFDSLVMLYSDDGSKARTRGILGWFIAGSSFPQLDDMMYAMKPGDITPHPLRTGFGYHFFTVLDRQTARQRLRPAQILRRLDLEHRNDTAAAFKHLSILRDSIQRGLATFEELAQRHSEDTVSGPQGGDLGWMTRGTNIEGNFEDALLGLAVGELSHPIRTPFGMHLVKLLDEEAPQPFDEQKDNLRRIYRNERFATDFLNYTATLRKRYNVTVNTKVVERVLSRMDATIMTSTPGWDQRLTREDREAYLVRTDAGPITVAEAAEYIKREQTVQMRNFSSTLLDTVAIMMADRKICVAETKGFEEQFPEFRRLVSEYSSASLITRLEELEIWNKVQASDEEVHAWWQEHHAEFILPPRVKIAEIFTYTEKMAQIYKDSLYAGLDFSYLAGRYTQRAGYSRVKGEWDYMVHDYNELSQRAATIAVGQIVGPFRFQDGFSLIKLLDKQEAREQTWEEARSAAVGVYKNELAKRRRADMLRELRLLHQVEEYPSHLKYAFPPAEKKN